MKNSGLLKWTINAKHKNGITKNGNKNWVHPADALQGGHVVYLVKFLGSTEVGQAKGIEVVKEAITKLRFTQQIRKSEGSKIPKVELTISVDGVAIQQPKTKKVQSQYPLHRISYCADDKAEKRFFSFIAKEADREAHTCYVFVSDKLAEEITLTIGQAFDLAYRRFLESSSREIELRRQVATLQHQLHVSQMVNTKLKSRLSQLAQCKDMGQLEAYLKDNKLSAISDLSEDEKEEEEKNGMTTQVEIYDEPQMPPPHLPPVPPRNEKEKIPIIKDLLPPQSQSDEDDDDDFNPRALESLPCSSSPIPPPVGSPFADDHEFNPRADEQQLNSNNNGGTLSPVPSLLPPPPIPVRPGSNMTSDLLADPFASPLQPITTSPDDLLAHFNEMKAGFSRGIAFGSADDDFTLESLDPLKN